MHKSSQLLMIIFLSIFNISCLTTELYNVKKESFNEEVRGFLITQDQKQLVLVGLHYHYIFPMAEDLKNILTWSDHSKLRATRLNFVISKNNVINGTYILKNELNAPLTDTDKAFLLENHFHLITSGQYAYIGKLSQGSVYETGNFKLPEMQSFKKPYYLEVSYDYATTKQTLTKVLVSPLAVAADGINTVLGAIVAVPLGIAFASGTGEDYNEKVQ